MPGRSTRGKCCAFSGQRCWSAEPRMNRVYDSTIHSLESAWPLNHHLSVQHLMFPSGTDHSTEHSCGELGSTCGVKEAAFGAEPRR